MQDDPISPPGDEHDAPGHPLERAHRFFQRAAPVIREATDALERHGGIDQVRDSVVERATSLVAKADEAIAKATAIEGVVVERDESEAVAAEPIRPAETAAARRSARRRLHYLELALLAFAATFGALVLQRRLRH